MWGRWMENFKDRIVQREEYKGFFVSTVFLGIDHRFDEGKPLLFETMVFNKLRDLYCNRTSTWLEALNIHNNAKHLIDIGDIVDTN